MKSDYDKCPKDEPCVLISNPVTIRCSRKLVDRNGEYKASFGGGTFFTGCPYSIAINEIRRLEEGSDSSGVENKVKEKLAI
jgi:hypothetical protein